MALTKEPLSGSTSGRGIKVVATATAGTTIHTQATGTWDEVWLWAVNSSTTDVKLTLEWGGVTSPDDLIEMTIPGEGGLYPIAPGLPIEDGVVVRAFAATANVVMIHGYVNRGP